MKNVIISLGLILSSAVGVAVATPSPALAADSVADCERSVFMIPPWYRGLVADADCNLKSPSDMGDEGMSSFIWTIALNLLQAAFVIAGYVSVGFIIRGGFKYMTTTGDPSGMSASKLIIKNAIIGLIISMAAAMIVNAVAGMF